MVQTSFQHAVGECAYTYTVQYANCKMFIVGLNEASEAFFLACGTALLICHTSVSFGMLVLKCMCAIPHPSRSETCIQDDKHDHLTRFFYSET